MIKDTVIKGLGALAVVLGTAVFVLWKMLMHNRNRKDAELFVQSAPHKERDTVLQDLSAQRETFDQTVDALRDEVEKETKKEIVDGFKKAFGMRPAADDGDVDEQLRRDK